MTTLRGCLRARFALVALLLALTACAHQQQAQTDATTTRPPLEVRHDTEELSRTFPALGTPVSASWIRWDNSRADEQPPAVKVVWIDAVVQVTPQTMNALLTQHNSEESDQHPAVQKVLESQVPPGPFRTGVELSMAFSQGRTSARVFLDPPRNTVVLQAYTMG
ncbi:hypothetical protein [Mycolicibacterium chubuense]|nr:hypothetical protein [Mycolicibacterium chubuense]